VRQLNAILNKYIRDKQPPEVLEAARSQQSNAKTCRVIQQDDAALFESFTKDAHKALSVIKELYIKNEYETNETDLRRITIFVHGIKSSLLNIGEKELSKTAAELETECRTKNFDAIRSQTPALIKELRAVLERIESEIDEINQTSENNENIAPEVLHEKLTAVKEMCGDYNRKGALDILAELGNNNEHLKKINEPLRNGDFKRAEKAIDDCLYGLPANKFDLFAREIDGLDLKKGIERYNGDEEVYLSILRSYVAATRSMLDVMENVTEENITDYKIKVHGIKGASRDMFAEKIGEAAAKLEEAAKEKDFDYINENNAPFIKATRELLVELDALISRIDAENPKPKKEKPDKKLLSEFLNACKAYNMGEADEAMTELRKYSYEAQSDNELITWLSDKFDIARFDDIVEKLSAVIDV
jgi:HPt (histidine-containing phosphotransfer) domain-containing protein